MTYDFEKNKMQILSDNEDKKSEKAFIDQLRSLIPKSFQVYKEQIRLEPTEIDSEWLGKNRFKSPKPNFTTSFRYVGKARYGHENQWTPIYSVRFYFFFSKRKFSLGVQIDNSHLKHTQLGPAKMLRFDDYLGYTADVAFDRKGNISKRMLSNLIKEALKEIVTKNYGVEHYTIGVPLHAIARRKDNSWAKIFNDIFSKLQYLPKYEQPVWIKAPERTKLGWIMKQMKQGKYGAPKRIRDLFAQGSQITPNLMVSKKFIEPLIIGYLKKENKPLDNIGYLVHSYSGTYQIIGLKWQYGLYGNLAYRVKKRGYPPENIGRTETDPITGQTYSQYYSFPLSSKVYPLPGRNILVRRGGKHILKLSDLGKTYQNIMIDLSPKISMPSVKLRTSALLGKNWRGYASYSWECYVNQYGDQEVTTKGDDLVYHINSDAFEFIIKICPPFFHHGYWDIKATCFQKPASWKNQFWPRFLSKLLIGNTGRIMVKASENYKDKDYDLFANLRQVITNDINPWLQRSLDFIKYPKYIGGKMLLCLTDRNLSMLQLKRLLKNMGFGYRTLSTAGEATGFPSESGRCVFTSRVNFEDTKQNRDAYAKYFVIAQEMENGKIKKNPPFFPNRITEYTVVRLDKTLEVQQLIKELK